MHNPEEKHELVTVIEQEKTSRSGLESRWLELWKLYKTEPLRLSTDSGWQSRLNDGRVFEIVETISTYLRSALFFSDNWLAVEATEPNLAEVLPLVNTHFRNLLNKSNLKREIRIFLRQLLLTGFSGMSVRWENDCLQYETVIANDTYIESSRRYDNNSYSFRRVYLNYADFLAHVESGKIETTEDPEEMWESLATALSADVDNKSYLTDTEDTATLQVVMYEYWCPIEKTIYRLVDGECVGEEEAKECPWLLMNLYEIPNSAYGLGVLDSSIGLILENNCIMNRRLDNMAVSVDNMWLFVDDGVTNPDDIKTEPGKVITVSSPDVLQPLFPPANNFNVTYNESALIDGKIEKNTGTGALISSGQYRSGERVTAEEINAVKDAGGNRLTDTYEHIESTFIVPLLMRSLELVKANVKKGVVKLASDRQGVYEYYSVLPKDFRHNYEIVVSASQSVINRDRNIRRINEFVQLAVGVPQFAEQVDFKNLFIDVLNKFGFDNPQRYMKQVEEAPAQPEAPSQPMSPQDAMVQGMGEIGGETMQNAGLQMAAGGQMAALMGGQPPGGSLPQMTPEEEQMLLAQQQQAITTPIG